MPLIGVLGVLAVSAGQPVARSAPVAAFNNWIAFEYAQRCIYVPVSVGGDKAQTFLLDTGANTSAIDETYARKLGLKVDGATHVEGTAGGVVAQQTKLSSIKCGAAQSKDLVVTVQDLSGLLNPEGKQTIGILGNDFLHHYAIQIDFMKEKVLLSEDKHEPDKKQIKIPIRLDNGIPRFTATLNQGVPCDFRIDTGASLFETDDIYVNIPPGTWDTLRRRDPFLRTTSVLKGVGLGGEIELPVGRINSLAVKEFSVDRPFVIVQPKQGYFARPDAAGFVSNNLLEKYSPVVVDYVGENLILTQNDL
jgi:predicted aspartyl protease